MGETTERKQKARDLLADVYKPEGVEIWLRGRKRSLGERRPIDLFGTEYEQDVFDAIERMRTGAAS